MSGGGGGGYGPSRSPDDCNIVEETPLNSVQAVSAALLTVGAQLDVEVVPQNGRSVLAARFPPGVHGAAIVGSLTPPCLADLLQCIDSGRSYVADVLSIQQPGALIRVRIHPR
jgi:hypothetical protein